MNALKLGTIVFSAAFATSLQAAAATHAADQHAAVLNVYGPGGPLPAMKDAAARSRRVASICYSSYNGDPSSPCRRGH
jgi:accessory colonization factor AcfC